MLRQTEIISQSDIKSKICGHWAASYRDVPRQRGKQRWKCILKSKPPNYLFIYWHNVPIESLRFYLCCGESSTYALVQSMLNETNQTQWQLGPLSCWVFSWKFTQLHFCPWAVLLRAWCIKERLLNGRSWYSLSDQARRDAVSTSQQALLLRCCWAGPAWRWITGLEKKTQKKTKTQENNQATGSKTKLENWKWCCIS